MNARGLRMIRNQEEGMKDWSGGNIAWSTSWASSPLEVPVHTGRSEDWTPGDQAPKGT